MIVGAEDRLPETFLAHAADVLGDTNSGLTGSEIAKAGRTYGSEYGVNVPYPSYPNEAPNKRTALFENLKVFSGVQQHRILRELCKHRSFGFKESPERREIRIRLATTYAKFDGDAGIGKVNEVLVEETRHWLHGYPDALTVYNEAIGKFRSKLFERNVLDDLRLALELLLKAVLDNGKSLENQIPVLGQFIKQHGGSLELSNMFVKLADYYCKYQNNYVKHDNSVIEQEIEFVVEITSSFMKHIVRMHTEA
jgi:hypothetical protein